MDRIVRIYETSLWYPWFIAVFAGPGSTSLSQLTADFSGSIALTQGYVLDIACGPATYTRRIASEHLGVVGIDVSMSMLRRGAVHVKQDRCEHVHLSQADALHLPFQASRFDAVICGGALLLFEDTFMALSEMNRVLKPGATLNVTTLIAGDRGLLKYQAFQNFIRRNFGFGPFNYDDLMDTLHRAGFQTLEKKLYGSLIFFSARKAVSLDSVV